MRRTRRPRRLLAVAVGTPVVLTALAVGAGPTVAADACFTFGAVAASDGVRTSASSPGELVVETADVQGPAAQATANSLGQSEGYAGAPYPGDVVVSAAAQGGADPASVPTYVLSQYPTAKKVERSAGSVTLTAVSEQTASNSKAVSGGGSSDGQAGGGTSVSTATAGCAATGDITADATSDSEALNFAAGTLRIGRIQSEAHAKIGKSGKPELSSSLTVGQMTVVGQTVAFTDEGIVYPGGSLAQPGNPLAEALKGNGVTVTYIAGEKDPDGKGITAPGVQVSTSRQVTGTGPTVVTHTYGRARARASGEPGSDAPATTGGDTGSADTSGETSAEADSGLDTGSTDRAAGADTGLPADAPAPDVAAGRDGTDGGSGGEATRQRLASSVDPLSLGLPLGGIYLALVVGAAAVLGGGSLIRLVGVRLAWI